MNHKTCIVLALGGGLLGGAASQSIVSTLVFAQSQAPVVQEIRARRFVLVDETGAERGVLGFAGNGNPNLEVMDQKGRIWGFQPNPFRHDKVLSSADAAGPGSK